MASEAPTLNASSPCQAPNSARVSRPPREERVYPELLRSNRCRLAVLALESAAAGVRRLHASPPCFQTPPTRRSQVAVFWNASGRGPAHIRALGSGSDLPEASLSSGRRPAIRAIPTVAQHHMFGRLASIKPGAQPSFNKSGAPRPPRTTRPGLQHRQSIRPGGTASCRRDAFRRLKPKPPWWPKCRAKLANIPHRLLALLGDGGSERRRWFARGVRIVLPQHRLLLVDAMLQVDSSDVWVQRPLRPATNAALFLTRPQPR